MRLLFTSLLAGGCLLAASAVASADELRLDDAALDNVTAGFDSIETRRNLLVGTAAIEFSNLIVAEFNEDPVGNAGALPVILPIVLTLQEFGNSLLPPPPP